MNGIEVRVQRVYLYSQLTFFFIVPRSFNGGKKSFQQMALGQLEIHMQKNEASPPIIYQKELKWIEVLNVRQTKTKKT